jgi:hypothetical protein
MLFLLPSVSALKSHVQISFTYMAVRQSLREERGIKQNARRRTQVPHLTRMSYHALCREKLLKIFKIFSSLFCLISKYFYFMF